MAPKVLCIMGPTASGKTDLAIQLQAKLNLDLISVDSAMVYKHMDIGTAKPDARHPHRLINLINPDKTYSAAQFIKDLDVVIKQSLEQNKIPCCVGGTMLYFHAMQKGLSDLPDADLDIRERITKKAEQYGWPALHQELIKIDPEAAAKIKPTDPQRIQRALSVYYQTQKPLSTHWQENPSQGLDYDFINIALIPNDRQWLHDRIEQRFKNILDQGFLEEVKQIINTYNLTKNHPALRTVGYRQAYEYLQGKIDYETFVKNAMTATRRLAKRQLTWLRQWEDCVRVEPTSVCLVDFAKQIKKISELPD